jgi:hypothetical protein
MQKLLVYQKKVKKLAGATLKSAKTQKLKIRVKNNFLNKIVFLLGAMH